MRRDNRPQEDDDGLPGQDSFLDIIANIVGILIILVMVVGVRASHNALALENTADAKPNEAIAHDTPQQGGQESLSDAERVATLRTDLEQTAKQIQKTQSEVEEMAGRVVNLSQEAQLQDLQRQKLIMHRSVIEEDLQRRREQLSAKQQQEYDVQRQIVQSQIELDELTREQLTLELAPADVEEVETVSTPLAKTVTGKEIHLRLKGGLVSIVPVEQLMEEVYPRVSALRSALLSRGEVMETFGPIDGYRLRLTLAKRAVAMPLGSPGHLQTPRFEVEQLLKFLPTSDDIGQNVEQALLPSSKLQKHLQANRREATPVTIWVYTDSFNEFRTLKRVLWEMGFPVAVRPMRPGAQIGASPRGTKSAAQ